MATSPYIPMSVGYRLRNALRRRMRLARSRYIETVAGHAVSVGIFSLEILLLLSFSRESRRSRHYP